MSVFSAAHSLRSKLIELLRLLDDRKGPHGDVYYGELKEKKRPFVFGRQEAVRWVVPSNEVS